MFLIRAFSLQHHIKRVSVLTYESEATRILLIRFRFEFHSERNRELYLRDTSHFISIGENAFSFMAELQTILQ